MNRNEIKTFNFQNSEVRTIIENDDVWFCLKDVCDVLGLSNVTVVSERLNTEGRVKYNLGRQGEAWFINESNLYKVIFQSRKPEAEKFTEWVTSDVLPTIRKHGAYMNEQTLEQALTNPDFLIKLATELKEEQQKRKQLEVEKSKLSVENEIMRPKAEYFDELVDKNMLTNIRTTAKELKIKEKDFVAFLIRKKYLYRDSRGRLLPYANNKTDGLFEVKECANTKTSWAGSQTLITPKGREKFLMMVNNLDLSS